jgi:hypothetical protein
MLSRATEVGLMAPINNETVTAIGAALCAHWAAAKAVAKDQFWVRSQNWLDGPRHYLNYLNRVTSGR